MNHAAGLDGLGGSSYIDEVILRDGDDTSRGFHEEARTDLEDRLFYLQNWRADVVVTVLPAADSSSDPAVLDQVRYSPYGVPWAVSLADVTSVGGSTFAPDGQLTSDDVIAIGNWVSSSDLNGDIASTGQADPPATPDGAVDSNDVTVFVNAYGNDIGVTGRGVLSRWHSRKGYAGYEWDPGLERASRGVTVGGGDDPTVTLPPRSMWHVRHRVLDSETGRWTRRDPLGYVDGMGLWSYAGTTPTLRTDPFGFCSSSTVQDDAPYSTSTHFRNDLDCARVCGSTVNTPFRIACKNGQRIVCICWPNQNNWFGPTEVRKQVLSCAEQFEDGNWAFAECSPFSSFAGIRQGWNMQAAYCVKWRNALIFAACISRDSYASPLSLYDQCRWRRYALCTASAFAQGCMGASPEKVSTLLRRCTDEFLGLFPCDGMTDPGGR